MNEKYILSFLLFLGGSIQWFPKSFLLGGSLHSPVSHYLNLVVTATNINSGDPSIQSNEPNVLSSHSNARNLRNGEVNVNGEVNLVNSELDIYMANVQSISPRESYQIIKDLPIRQYYDVTKSNYKVGILGDDIKNTLPSYVSNTEYKYNHNGKIVSLPNFLRVDTSNLYIHFIGALNHIIQQLSTIKSPSIEQLNSQYSSVYSQLCEMKVYLNCSTLPSLVNITYNETWKSSAVLRKANEIRQRKITNLQNSIEELRKDTKSLVSSHQTNLLQIEEMYSNHFSVIDKLSANSTKYDQFLRDFYVEYVELESLNIESDSQDDLYNFVYEHNMTLDKLIVDSNIALSTVTFRIEEGMRLSRETENYRMKLLSFEHLNHMKTIENVFEKLFEKVNTNVQSILATRSREVASYAVIVILCVILIAFILEGLNNLVEYLTMYFRYGNKRTLLNVDISRNAKMNIYHNYRRHQPHLTANLAQLENQNNLIFFGDDYILHRLMHLNCSFNLLSSTSESAPTPNVVILGEKGTGKTSLVDLCAASCNVHVARIRANDILSFPDSHSSGKFLQELVRKFASNRKPTLICIDDCDELIRKRTGYDVDLRDCLYVLLQAMNTTSSYNKIGFILSASLPISDVDTAIMDRMDFQFELKLPSAKLRLDFIIFKCHEILLDMCDDKSKSVLNLLVKDAIGGNSKNSDTYSEIIKALESNQSPDLVDKEFDIKNCMLSTALLSNSFSFRDLLKILNAVRSEVLSSLSCEISNSLWLRELHRAHSKTFK